MTLRVRTRNLGDLNRKRCIKMYRRVVEYGRPGDGLLYTPDAICGFVREEVKN